LILPVHKSLEFNEYTYTNIRFPKQGIKAFVKNIKTPIVEVVNGFDFETWRITDLFRKPNSFLTVTTSIGATGYLLKGIDMILELAKQKPHFNFTIVGKVFLPEACPKNVRLIENVPHEQLIEIFNQHQFYLQLSMSEGFPNALCEAMLCGCIPIGSNVAAIPDIIGNEGYILKNKSKDALENLVSELESPKPTPESVRKRIVEKFPLDRRKKELINQIKSLLKL
jgi:glycosyltransferase involved in cell wall biosynthesis